MKIVKKTVVLVMSLLLIVNATAQRKVSNEMDYARLLSTLKAIEEKYVDTVNVATIADEAINAMLKKLDPHSTYIPLSEVKRMDEPLMGNFEGVGIQFNILSDTLMVVATISGGPSEKVGIKAGDRIVTVDNKNVAGTKITNEQVFKMLRGDKGTVVNLKVKRRNIPELIDFRVVRDRIPIFSIDASYMVSSKIGYIKISRFSATTYDEFIEALNKLKKDGMVDLIIDLQDNGGGFLQEPIEMATEMLPENSLVVFTKGEHSPRQDFASNRKPGTPRRKFLPGGKNEIGFYQSRAFEKGNLVVLIDESSASASEIFSGAIQDWDRGVIVGRRSFGKGLVQSRIDLPDRSMLRLTTARYYTPSGRCIQKSYAGGDEDYEKDILNRYNGGELFHKDSIKFADTLEYKTLKSKRTVYGGGGIMPDIFVPLDTAGSSPYHRDLIARGILNTFIISLVDNDRKALLARYPKFEDFDAGFVVDDAMLDALVAKGEKDGLKKNADGLKKAEVFIKLQIKALVARDLYDQAAFFKVMNKADHAFAKAVELLNDSKAYKEILVPKK